MTTLTDFLLARIAEDKERELARVRNLPIGITLPDVAHNRVLAECEAKRRIVEDLALPYIAERRRLMRGQPSWGDEHPDLLRLLALPYADHPDYRQEWKP